MKSSARDTLQANRRLSEGGGPPFHTTQTNALGDLMMPAIDADTLQSSAALRTGTRVEKINSKRGDSHVNAAHGIVTSSLGPEMWSGQMTQGYLVTWDDCKAAAFVVGNHHHYPNPGLCVAKYSCHFQAVEARHFHVQ